MKDTIVEATHSAEKVKQYYAWRASNYDAGAKFEVEHHAEALRLAEIQKGQRVLDAACGTGRGTVGWQKLWGLGVEWMHWISPRRCWIRPALKSKNQE